MSEIRTMMEREDRYSELWWDDLFEDRSDYICYYTDNDHVMAEHEIRNLIMMFLDYKGEVDNE